MPTLKCFKKTCTFSSDDLVPVSCLAVAIRIAMLTGGIGIAMYVGIKLDVCQPNILGILIAFLFGAILTSLLLLTIDCNLLAVSARGNIMAVHYREPTVHVMIGLQLLLSLMEIGVSVLGGVSAWHPDVTNNITCAIDTNVMKVVSAYVIIMWILLTGKAFYFLILFDPFNCCAFHPASYVDDSDDEEDAPKYERVVISKRSWRHLGVKKTEAKVDSSKKKLYNKHTAKFWGRTLTRLTRKCCACRKQREESSVLDLIAKDLAILFCEKTSGLVLSDVAAALVLAKKEQQSKIKVYQESVKVLTLSQMRENKGQLVEMAGDGFVIGKYTRELHEPRSINLQYPPAADVRRLKEAIYFFQYSIGVYGWPMYCFERPFTGCCKLTGKLGDLCPCRGGNYQFDKPSNDPCGCNTAALAISAKLSKHQIVHISNQNELFRAPYAVLLDNKEKTLVITIRGTMSLKDVLTDLSISLKEYEMEERPFNILKTQVHLGMHQTAMNIAEELLQLKILSKSFEEFPDYTLTIVGHSLGAGVASVLALLFKTDGRLKGYASRGMKCFAYSPPGCVFSYPLAEYSKKFVTTLVVNSDAVPCLNWRSLLLLKHTMLKHLNKCTKPKHQVLYGELIPKPTCMHPPQPDGEELTDGEYGNEQDVDPFIAEVFSNSRCLNDLGKFRQKPLVIHSVRQIVNLRGMGRMWMKKAHHDHPEHENAEDRSDNLPSANTTSEAIVTALTGSDTNGTTHNSNSSALEKTESAEVQVRGSISNQGSSLDEVKHHLSLSHQLSVGFADEATDVSPVPTFIPGIVYHIQTKRQPSCLPFVKNYNCKVAVKANEDFGVIRLDKTTLQSHLPNHVGAALKLLDSQLNSEGAHHSSNDEGFSQIVTNNFDRQESVL